MSKILYNRIYRLLLFVLAAVCMLPACKKDMTGPPVVTSVRNYAASPNDTIVQTVNPDQWVVIEGRNLNNVTTVLFSGVSAAINATLLTDKNIVIQIPSIPFQSVPRDKVNEITVISEGGMATYKINVIGAPIITHVRNYSTLPAADTIVQAVTPEQQISLIGYNLKNATNVSFQGIEADLTDVIYTDSSTVVKVPKDLSGGDVSLANTITYTTEMGTSTFTIQIIGPPIILNVSNENPNPGDSVYVYGNNLFSIESLTFAGMEVSSFDASIDGSSVGFVVPSLTQSGPVIIRTEIGTATTAYNVNDVLTGIITDFEWGPRFHWEFWGGAELGSGNADFPGNSTQYLMLKTNILASGAGDEHSTAMRIGNVQWLPTANLADPISTWVLKFEVNIPHPWKGGTLCIKSASGDYMARVEPWQISSTSQAAYSTKGWQTMTIPFSEFRKNDAVLGDGKGAPITNLTALLGSTGLSNLVLYMHNYSSRPTETGFNAAFDNLRVVKR